MTLRKSAWMLIGGLGIIAATNAIALLGVAYNRAGEPASRVELTERELILPVEWGIARESSAIFLKLRWRVACERIEGYGGLGAYCATPWLSRAKLAELGFNVTPAADTPQGERHYERLQSRELYLVTEVNGAAYQAALAQARDWAEKEQALAALNPGNKEMAERARRARDRVREEEESNSRLFVIDAGRDADALRARYPDGTRYAIVRGRVQPPRTSKGQGYVEELSIDRLYVPRPLRELFVPLIDRVGRGDQSPRPRYTVLVAYGARAEPWLIDAALGSQRETKTPQSKD